MIKFVINREHKVQAELGKIEIKDSLSQEDEDWLVSLPITGYDLETNSLDPFTGDILLVILGSKELQYVIDPLSINCQRLFERITEEREGHICFIGANIKFDYSFAKVKYNVVLKKMYDVMIAEQRLVQGSGLSAALVAIVERRLGFVPPAMQKDIRLEFIGADPKTFLFDNRHVEYGAEDIVSLFDIRDVQKAKISALQLDFLIYGIEFPLIRVLADAELEGVLINEDKWLKNVVEAKTKRYDFLCQLDTELRSLRDTFVQPEDKITITGGKWDRERKEELDIVQGNLFGDMFEEIPINHKAKEKTKTKAKREPYVNYGSHDQLLYIFATLKQPLPTETGMYIVPTFTTKALKGGRIKRIVDKTFNKFTTGEGAVESYLNENPKSPIKKFIKLLIDYREQNTLVNTFGAKFLKKYKNAKTKRFHTTYRQCTALNGRLQSGDKKNKRFNSQNIPAKKNYREPFIAEDGWSMCTTDLSGAEATIMIDKARDEKFYEIAIKNDDAHSPLGMAVWRTIGNYRVTNDIKTIQEWDAADGSGRLKKTPTELLNITISKKENKEIRSEFKNTTFASIYGCHFKKYSKMLNITHEEAKLGLKVMEKSIPKTFRMVKDSAQFAIENGYLIHNYRTNSRIWYPAVLEAKKNRSDIAWSDQHDIEGSARNSPISGTQADMIKEMMVEIDRTVQAHNLPAKLIFQVHDELVYKFRNDCPTLQVALDVTKPELTEMTFPQYVKHSMCTVANRYLSFIKMSAEQHIGNSWTK